MRVKRKRTGATSLHLFLLLLLHWLLLWIDILCLTQTDRSVNSFGCFSLRQTQKMHVYRSPRRTSCVFAGDNASLEDTTKDSRDRRRRERENWMETTLMSNSSHDREKERIMSCALLCSFRSLDWFEVAFHVISLHLLTSLSLFPLLFSNAVVGGMNEKREDTVHKMKMKAEKRVQKFPLFKCSYFTLFFSSSSSHVLSSSLLFFSFVLFFVLLSLVLFCVWC